MRTPARSLGLAALFLVSASEMSAAMAEDDLTCSIDLTLREGQAAIRGVAISKDGGRGTYRLLVRKSGSNGTSDVSQGGQLVLEPNARSDFGMINLSLEGGAHYEAVLTLEVNGNRRECRKSGQADLKL